MQEKRKIWRCSETNVCLSKCNIYNKTYNLSLSLSLFLSHAGDTRNGAIIVVDGIDGNDLLFYGGEVWSYKK